MAARSQQSSFLLTPHPRALEPAKLASTLRVAAGRRPVSAPAGGRRDEYPCITSALLAAQLAASKVASTKGRPQEESTARKAENALNRQSRDTQNFQTVNTSQKQEVFPHQRLQSPQHLNHASHCCSSSGECEQANAELPKQRELIEDSVSLEDCDEQSQESDSVDQERLWAQFLDWKRQQKSSSSHRPTKSQPTTQQHPSVSPLASKPRSQTASKVSPAELRIDGKAFGGLSNPHPGAPPSSSPQPQSSGHRPSSAHGHLPFSPALGRMRPQSAGSNMQRSTSCTGMPKHSAPGSRRSAVNLRDAHYESMRRTAQKRNEEVSERERLREPWAATLTEGKERPLPRRPFSAIPGYTGFQPFREEECMIGCNLSRSGVEARRLLLAAA